MPIAVAEPSLRVYNNLKGKTLKPDAKRWIYDGIKGNLEDDTNWNALQGEDIVFQLTCMSDISKRYGIPESTIRHFFKRFDDQLPVFEAGKGQPLAIGKKRVADLARNIVALQKQNKAPDYQAVRKLIHTAKQDTYLDNTNGDITGLSHVKHIDVRTEKKLLTSLNGSYKKPNVLTTAREKSGLDPLTAISWAILLLAFAGRLPATNKVNFDGTSCEIKDGTNSHRVFIIKKDPDDVLIVTDNVRSSSQQQSTSLFIKLMHIVAASGDKGPMVVVLAHKDLPEGVFYSAEVLGLQNTTERRKGMIYLAKSRAGNPAMWQHFFLETLIPWISSHAVLHDTPVSSCTYITI